MLSRSMREPRGATDSAATPGEDLIEGAGPIAAFLLGADTPATRRQIYYLTSEAPAAARPPIFRLGAQKLAARRSTLLRWIAEREAAATGSQAA